MARAPGFRYETGEDRQMRELGLVWPQTTALWQRDWVDSDSPGLSGGIRLVIDGRAV